jgi:hypothetical protein
MKATIKHNEDDSITVCYTFSPGKNMLESELNLQKSMNEAAALATGECLKCFDTDGSKIAVGGFILTSKGRVSNTYQTPYGAVKIERHVYQSSKGGATFCPLDQSARIMRRATPLFAKQASCKYANGNAETVKLDFAQHGRKIDRSYVNEIALDVASVIQEKENYWSYEVPEAPAGDRIACIAVGVDGTCTLLVDGGWRQTMVGTIAFYNPEGERLTTIYIANAPEYGKETFFEKMETELERVKKKYPDVVYAGIADGAHELWTWLEKHCPWRIVDFWHASEYLAGAKVQMKRGKLEQKKWLEDACHRLKHDKGGVKELLREMEESREIREENGQTTNQLDKAISYFGNHQERMDYHLYRAMDLPIGSGVTEAACKSIVKERLCGSGMKWSLGGMEGVLNLRTLIKSEGRWESFWEKAMRHGFTKIAHPKRG